MVLRITLFILLFLKLNAGNAQDFFDNFQITTREQKVILTMVIKAGNTCQGLNFYRSIDSINYQLFGRIGGVCGNLTEPASYTFLDEVPPLNQTIYYKVEIAGYGYSSTLQIIVREAGLGSYLVAPNPSISGQTKLLFTGFNFSNAIGKLFNQTGQLTKQYAITGIDQTILLFDIPDGIYYLKIYSTDGQFIEAKTICKQ